MHRTPELAIASSNVKHLKLIPILMAVLLESSIFPSAKLAIATTSANHYQASKYREQGLSYRQQERYADAIASMQAAVALQPDHIDGRVNLGWTQHLAGDESAAAQSLSQAAYLDPSHVQTFNALGIVYLVRGDLSAAVLTHLWAMVLKPENEIAHYNLSLALHRLQHYDGAIKTASQAITLEPNNPHPLVALAIAHWDRDDRRRAQAVYRQAIELDSRYREGRFPNLLKEAGFSREQIQTTEQIRATLNQ